MTGNKSQERLSRKLDAVLWFLLALLPVIVYFVMYYRTGNAVPFSDYINDIWRFDFIANIFESVFSSTGVFGSSFAIVPYVSYLVSVEIMRVFFYVIAFIPRFAYKFLTRGF